MEVVGKGLVRGSIRVIGNLVIIEIFFVEGSIYGGILIFIFGNGFVKD